MSKLTVTPQRSISLLLIAVFLSFKVSAQTPVTADPAVVSFDITNLSDVSVNAEGLIQGHIYKLKLLILNTDQVNAIPAGTAQIRIGLGTKLVMDPNFDI